MVTNIIVKSNGKEVLNMSVYQLLSYFTYICGSRINLSRESTEILIVSKKCTYVEEKPIEIESE